MAITIISDKVNRAGFRVNVPGIKLDNYAKNPILLFMHSRASEDWKARTKDEERLPVGKLVNVRVDKGHLVADDPIWDETDEFALKLKAKFEGGFMNAFSAGLLPLTISDDPAWLLKGQTRSTIVDSEMLEVSFVDIPKDGLAVRLSMADNATLDEVLPLIKQQSNQFDMNLEKIALQLGLDKGATEAEILAAMQKMNAEVEAHRKSRTATLLALGRERGVVDDTNAAQWENLMKLDFDSTEALLKNAKPSAAPEASKQKQVTAQDVLKLAQSANAGGNAVTDDGEDRSKWTFLQWSREDPKGLNDIRLQEPERYEKLALAYKPEKA